MSTGKKSNYTNTSVVNLNDDTSSQANSMTGFAYLNHPTK